MSNRSLIILWAIAAALLVAILIVKVSEPDSPTQPTNRKAGDLVFEAFQAEEIATIAIATGEESVTITKKNGSWTVSERADYPADFQSVNSLIRALNETKITQALRAGTSYDERFGLSSPDGITIEFENEQGKRLHQIAIGKEAGEPNTRSRTINRFVRTGENPDDVYSVDGTFAGFTTSPADWLKDDFFRVTRLRRIETTDWTLVRNDEGSDFLSKDGKTLKQESSSAINGLFAFNRFTDVVVDPAAIAEGDQKVAKLDTFDGFSYTIHYQAIKDDSSNYLLTVDVDASINESRVAPEGETDEQKEAADTAFATQQKTLKDKLAQEEVFEGITYKVPQSMVAQLLKSRDELLTTAQTGSVETLPNGTRTAVTPPIQIPQR